MIWILILKKTVKKLQKTKNVKSNANDKSVFLPVPIPMPVPAKAISTSVPASVKKSQPDVVKNNNNVKKKKKDEYL